MAVHEPEGQTIYVSLLGSLLRALSKIERNLSATALASS